MAEITLAGRTLRMKPEMPPTGQMMKIADAENSGDGSRALGLYYRLLKSMVVEEDHQAVDEAIDEVNLEDISQALKEGLAVYSKDPTSAGPASSSRSLRGSQAGAPTSRVVSFSKGTVQVQEAAS